MADEKSEEVEGGKKKKGKMMIIIPAVVLLAGIGGGGYFFMASKKGAACPATETTEAAAGVLQSVNSNGQNLNLQLASSTATTAATKKTTATTAAGKAAEGATTTTTIDPACAEKVEPEVHGPIVRLSPITMNLSDGHVLKVGLALQLAAEPEDEHLAAVVAAASAGGHGAADTGEIKQSPLGGAESKALDAAITELGNSTYAVLSSPAGRAAAKEQLTKDIKDVYHDDVEEVYFTDFVMS